MVASPSQLSKQVTDLKLTAVPTPARQNVTLRVHTLDAVLATVRQAATCLH